MNPTQVFRKTGKGREEIEKRTHRLDARKRMLLIVVDGQSDAQALAQKVAHLDDAMGMLAALWTDGFVEPVEDVAAAPPGPAATPARASPGAGGPLSLDALKRLGSEQVQRLMGPDGDSLALKLEKARTVDEFFAEARKVRDALSAFLGPKKAEAFARALDL